MLMCPLNFTSRSALSSGDHVEDAAVLAEDHVGVPLVVVVLEVHAEVAGAHLADLLGRVELLAELGGADQVAGVQARADQRVDGP